MPQVSKITPQRRAGYFNIFLDGKYALSLDESALLASRLAQGDEIPPEKLSALKKLSLDVKIFDKLLRFATVRPRSEKELSDYLRYKRRLEDDSEVNALLQRLARLNLLDDEAFARWWQEQRTQQGKGNLLIKQELRLKGVSSEIIKKVCSVMVKPERELISELVERKLKSQEGILDKKSYQRLVAFLMRRGFSWEDIKEVLTEVVRRKP